MYGQSGRGPEVAVAVLAAVDEGPPEDPSRTYVWLGHVDDGYATRPDGPAASP